MPQIFRIGSYLVYIWSNENLPVEPIRVHVSENRPAANATKVWLTRAGHCIVAKNSSKIPLHILNDILAVIETRFDFICKKWTEQFGEIRFFC